MEINQPEDLVFEVKKLLNKKKGKLFPIVIVALLIVIGLTGTFYTIEADEVGVLRAGLGDEVVDGLNV